MSDLRNSICDDSLMKEDGVHSVICGIKCLHCGQTVSQFSSHLSKYDPDEKIRPTIHISYNHLYLPRQQFAPSYKIKHYSLLNVTGIYPPDECKCTNTELSPKYEMMAEFPWCSHYFDKHNSIGDHNNETVCSYFFGVECDNNHDRLPFESGTRDLKFRVEFDSTNNVWYIHNNIHTFRCMFISVKSAQKS